MLYRVFPEAPGARPGEPGSATYVARSGQGSGRHDNPSHYGAFYASRRVESAIAERIQHFRGESLSGSDLRRPGGRRLALATFDDSSLDGVIDLDDPDMLSKRELRPSLVATRHRAETRRIALGIFREGAGGLGWWSTLEASWPNVTLFAERLSPPAPIDEPQPLSIDHPALVAAAQALGVLLS
ncbi:MAG: RES family NAD+ phosphorylase [Actinobacteria bacterium]|nr:RES family NAD+ phosphorylase [Actinomycetota bacterium]